MLSSFVKPTISLNSNLNIKSKALILILHIFGTIIRHINRNFTNLEIQYYQQHQLVIIKNTSIFHFTTTQFKIKQMQQNE